MTIRVSPATGCTKGLGSRFMGKALQQFAPTIATNPPTLLQLWTLSCSRGLGYFTISFGNLSNAMRLVICQRVPLPITKGASHVVDDLCDTVGVVGGRTCLFIHAGRLHPPPLAHRVGGSLD